ncbi:MAG: DNA polymerase III subunit gamma/tau [Candidatus Eremiobacteraeota bacterium]|nr:DNA polymerase III subunit gamma/tau [Candidatus Eremiobacteraeota bacterium]
MCAVSLYRTWRPLTFADLVGQDAVVRTLTAAIESGKLAHAYLFSGPRGSGKTSAAKILARCVNCASGPTSVPDNSCDNCTAMLAGTALDVLEIDAASNRGIDEIRALREAVKFAPATMRMKIYIIDEAHMLTREGANAFLKTLEEPPPHALFILATTEPEKLPVTILSRCQRYAFRRIAVPVMIDRMREIAGREGIAVEESALAAIAYRAEGGLRDALTILEQLAAFAQGAPIDSDMLDVAFGSSGRSFAQSLIDAIIARDPARALTTVESASDAGIDFQVLIRTLIAGFRNLLIARIDPDLLSRDLAPEDAARTAAAAEPLAQATLVRALRTFGEGLALARSGGNARLELEAAVLRFILWTEDPSPDALSARVAALEARLTAPAPELTTQSPKRPVNPPASPGRSEAVSLHQVRAAWQRVRTKVESERQPLRAVLSRAAVEAVDGNAVVLKLPSDWNAQSVREHARLIESAIEEVLGVSLRVRTTVDSSGFSPASVPETPDADALFDYANERIR